MNCPRVLARLNTYADGELSRFRARGIARHLKDCASCRARLAELRALESLLADVPVPPLPEGFSARLLAEAARRMPERRPQPLQWLPSGVRTAIFGMPVPMRLAACGTGVLACLVGVSTGRIVSTAAPEAASTRAQALYGMEWFGSAPPMSLTAFVAESSPGSRGGLR
ncbi:MAG: zf-HC2 domain-containing protein [Deltaproteobacteria bacterium]|nr:zf-HC2 domain-containing protein [Deltaproteobacteria bacterium]